MIKLKDLLTETMMMKAYQKHRVEIITLITQISKEQKVPSRDAALILIDLLTWLKDAKDKI